MNKKYWNIEEKKFVEEFIEGKTIELRSTEKKDISGKIIFEGDLVLLPADESYGYLKGKAKEIIYKDGNFFLYPYWELINTEELKIIGNIYEDPEYLKYLKELLGEHLFKKFR